MMILTTARRAVAQGMNFVLSSLGLMRGGEIFVPRNPSMRISGAEWLDEAGLNRLLTESGA